MKGRIHSCESFATLDGGGIRFCVFMQGCPLKCVYCHNPDTQEYDGGKLVDVEELVATIDKKKNYYINGGVTFSGGEPLAQGEFLECAIRAIKEKSGLHVAVDTSLGFIPRNFDAIIELTDLFIVDLKFYNLEDYKRYCSGDFNKILDGINRISQANRKIVLRTVILPGINDKIVDVDMYLSIAKNILSLEKYELLGYHDMGRIKYKELGRAFLLENLPPMDKLELRELQMYVNKVLFDNSQ